MADYYEDDWVAEVQILDDTSDNEFERYKLKVVSKMFVTPENGHIFDVEQKHDCGNLVFELRK